MILSSLRFLAIIIAVAVMIVGATAWSQSHSNPWLLTWISQKCCVGSDCCTEVASSALTSLLDDEWRVNASGQVLKRTDYSPDGKYYRCACGWKQDINTTNHTYCVFVPLNSM